MAVEQKRVKKVSDKLTKFVGTWNKIPESEDYIGVTEWENGEGIDVCIRNNIHFSLHRDELEAIWYLMRVLDYEFK